MISPALDAVAIGTCYVDTNVDNFPFDSHGITSEELIGERYEVVPGGSAVNFCRLGSTLGLRTAFIGMAGGDSNGDTLESLLDQQGVRSAIIRRPDLLTNIGFNITNPQGEHIMLIAGTANAALDPAAVLPRLEEILPNTSMLYMGGCLKLRSFAHAFGKIADLADSYSVKIVTDHGRVPDGVTPEMREAVRTLVLRSTYYFPSREEFCVLWDVPDVNQGLIQLQQQAPGLTVVVKDGPNGAFYWADGSMRHVQAERVAAVLNPTGAGDSFNAGVMKALSSNRPLPEAIAYGCKIAAAKITSQPLPQL